MSLDDFEIREQGRRLVAETPYDEDFVTSMRSINANWDPDAGVWWIGKTSSDDKTNKFREAYEQAKARHVEVAERKRSFKDECDRRRNEGLALKIPYDHRELAKERDGIWDGKQKKWLMPDKATKTEVEQIIADKAKRAKKRRHEERQEIREREKHERRKRIMAEVGAEAWDDVLVIRGGAEHQCDMPSPGKTFRSNGHDTVVTVAYAEGPKRVNEGRSFGYNFDDGYSWILYCREATEDEARPVLEKENRIQKRRDAIQRLSELEKRIRENGEYPDPDDGMNQLDETFCERSKRLRLYGGGSWFGLTENHVWFVRNNGADGDTWGRNNVRTGGAGAVGWRIERNDEIVAELKQLDEVLDTTS